MVVGGSTHEVIVFEGETGCTLVALPVASFVLLSIQVIDIQ